jgi:threonine dehydrogenase-like Zn-dependent dehydrogenase
MEQSKQITAGIIGAGRRGQALLEILLKSGSVNIQYIVDKDTKALAFGFAKKNSIATLNDVDAAIKQYRVDHVFEMTGDEQVLQLLQEKCPHGTHIINHKVSLFFFDLLDRTREKVNNEIVGELLDVKKTLTNSSKIIRESSKEVDKVAVNITLLSINAGIEASRAGDVGRGFAVVAQAVKETADNVRMLSQRIEDVNKDSVDAVQIIDSSLKKLSSR